MTSDAADPAPQRLDSPDISAWRHGTDGIPYAVRRRGPAPGPEIMVTALLHGNEVCGAHALRHLLTAGPRPRRGAVTAVFGNVAAFAATASGRPAPRRFVEQDLNRLWSPAALDGGGDSIELARARELRPLVDAAELLLDLHSMQNPGPPLALAGAAAKGRALAAAVGAPAVVVADSGHAAGTRLREYAGFADPASPRTALLVECGQHQDPASAAVATEVLYRFLRAAGVVDPADVAPFLPAAAPPPQRVIEVTHAVTAETDAFRLLRPFPALATIPRAGTLIGHDGRRAVRTPYADCVLVMPAYRVGRGQTAVRLGRVLPAADEVS